MGANVSATLLVVNPTSGGGRGRRRWRRLRVAVPEVEAAPLILADSAEQASDELRRRLEAGGIERVIAVGGDGTAHLVANALLTVANPSPVAMGLVPVGTGSDLARHLALPRRPVAALRHALGAEARSFDAIALSTADGRRRHCINIASGGLSGAVVLALGNNPRRGQLSYLGATLSALVRFQPGGCRVWVDDQEIHGGPLFLVAVANGEFFGKGMRVAPSAESDDGRLEIIVIPPVSRWKLPWRLPQFFSGAHLRWPGVVHRQGSRVRLEPASGFPPFELDGEPFPVARLTLEVQPGVLKMLV